MTESIGVRELRQHASRWLEKVRSGESFAITVRGRPVARLVPFEEPMGYQGLLDAGLIRPSQDPLSERLVALGPPPAEAPLSESLEELRSDER